MIAPPTSSALDHVLVDRIREARTKYLTDEKRVKAVTVCFTDLEGRLHMLDYDKKFLLGSVDNLTFDGSSRISTASQRASCRTTSTTRSGTSERARGSRSSSAKTSRKGSPILRRSRPTGVRAPSGRS